MKHINIRIALFAGLMMALTACTHRHEESALTIPDKRFVLNHESEEVNIPFYGQSTTLSPASYQEIALHTQQPQLKFGKSSVYVKIPARTAGPLGQKRLQAVVNALQKLGVKRSRIQKQASLPPADNLVSLIFDTYQAKPAYCSEEGHKAPHHQPGNYSCAVSQNFLLMIDDPKVLFQGAAQDTPETIRQGLAITNYRSGKDWDKPLKLEKTDKSE